MRKYRHIFFDLDRTLWDFDKNTALTLKEIIGEFKLGEKINNVDVFIADYHRYNDELWDQYRKKAIRKNELRLERFRRLFLSYGIEDEKLINTVSDYYVDHSPKKPELLDHANEVLSYLSKNYKLYIITNGFYEIQILKLKSSGIDYFFERVFTSEVIGDSKPSKKFFEYAVKTCNAKKKESLVIGDDPINDIAGAKQFGIDQVWLNPNNLKSDQLPTFMIKDLLDLKKIL